MDFNFRVLEESTDKRHPMMERVKFLGITASNLDEFFMVRVANIISKMEKKPNKKDASRLKPGKLFKILTEKIHMFSKNQQDCWKKLLVPELEKEKIKFLNWNQLDAKQKAFLENYFKKTILPILTPMAIDPGRPFPFITGRSLNIAIELKSFKGEKIFGIVNVPSAIPRYIEIPCKSERCFVLLEKIMKNQISNLFELYDIKSTCLFRVTRNSDFEINEEAESILTEVQKSIKKRRRGDVVRLEIEKKNSNSRIKKFLTKMFKVEKDDIYKIKGIIDLTVLLKFVHENWDPKIKFIPQIATNAPAAFCDCKNVFEAINEKDHLVVHPFESFDAVINFVQQAANDPDVLAIKQTLYRVSGNSPIITALMRAAENGKQVTAFVELKARFDEENNILWAQKLEKSGCHVVYGIPGLKTHCKVILVVRREQDSIKRYLHFGTGNYNDTTAKFYTDVGFFTCKNEFGIDASALFNSLTGYSWNSEYQKLIVSPFETRNFFEKMIDKEIENTKAGLSSKIIIKVNAIVDKKIINKLYEASNAGVEIKMIVRGICCLVPRVKNMSKNIQVISIVGRLLEHSRIFYFENNGSPLVFMGSTDLMPRNLDRRIEVIFPIEDEELKKRSIEMLSILLHDTVNARIQNKKAEYKRIPNEGKEIIDSQMEFFKIARNLVSEKS
jgi:polyphosphate kinase